MSYTPTLLEVIGGLGAKKLAHAPFQRANGGGAINLSTVAHRPNSYWNTQGSSGLGTFPTLGKANGRVCTKALAGAQIPIPANANLAAIDLAMQTSASTAAAYFLVDRLSDIQLLHSETTGALTGLDATAAGTTRLPAGAGCMLFAETVTAGSATTSVFNLTYTNQDGVGSRVTPDITTTASNAFGRSLTPDLWLPLQDGDVGVRSVESITAVSGSQTGNMSIALVRVVEVCMIATGGMGSWREQLYAANPLPQVASDACLSWIQLNFGSAGAGVLVGDIMYLVD